MILGYSIALFIRSLPNNETDSLIAEDKLLLFQTTTFGHDQIQMICKRQNT